MISRPPAPAAARRAPPAAGRLQRLHRYDSVSCIILSGLPSPKTEKHFLRAAGASAQCPSGREPRAAWRAAPGRYMSRLHRLAEGAVRATSPLQSRAFGPVTIIIEAVRMSEANDGVSSKRRSERLNCRGLKLRNSFVH
ncbi:hypothetical protein EVAR_97464_1 [Eumeta japonica]|uniref:Uncharacterized protein n=1 Tax=Eumeta variegata TaxID=151549 RepID=A0A4C1WZA6_EUMVA|nr:hypothetical protein EVAR_97464_1 [Eumeta japonica]